MKPLHVSLLVIGAMLVGAGITYWTVRQLPPVTVSIPAATAPAPAPVPIPNLAPTPPAPAEPRPPSATTPAPEENARKLPDPPALEEAALEEAIAAAKEARSRGEAKPVATTPEEFARELGAFNYELVAFIADFPEPPEDGSAEEKLYRERLDALTKRYANLSLDEELLAESEDSTPAQLAHLQAHLAAGSLALDAAGTAKLEEILRSTYEKLFPVEETDPEAEAKLDAATNTITTALEAFLSPDQRRRLDLMGADQVLFGLPQPEREP